MEHHSKPSVLITGIEGFTGYHLSSFLKEKGFRVYGTSLASDSQDIYKLDINLIENIKEILNEIKPDYIVHLAAISFVGHPNPEDFYKINTIGAELILKSLIEIGHIPKKVLIPSSATVYGNQGQSILNEEMAALPNNHYGCSKFAMERIVANYFSKIPIIVTRTFNYTGLFQSEHFLVPKLVKHFKEKKEEIFLGNLDVRREFNSVGFVSEVYFKLLESDTSSTIVNVCSSKTYSIEEILTSLENLSDHQIRVAINPEFVRKNEIRELKGSTALLSSLIDIPDVMSIDATLRQMLNA